MSAGMQPFLFEGDSLVRMVEQGGAPWFIGVDACRILDIRDHKQALERLDNDERGWYTIPTPGGDQQAIIVSEPGLYRLIFSSRKPVAERFKRWLSHEVLPAIREHGHYGERQPDQAEPDEEEVQTTDGLKLRKVNTAARIFGERAGAQLWFKLGLEIVPAMRPMMAQFDMLEIETVSVVTKTVSGGGSH